MYLILNGVRLFCKGDFHDDDISMIRHGIFSDPRHFKGGTLLNIV